MPICKRCSKPIVTDVRVESGESKTQLEKDEYRKICKQHYRTFQLLVKLFNDEYKLTKTIKLEQRVMDNIEWIVKDVCKDIDTNYKQKVLAVNDSDFLTFIEQCALEIKETFREKFPYAHFEHNIFLWYQRCKQKMLFPLYTFNAGYEKAYRCTNGLEYIMAVLNYYGTMILLLTTTIEVLDFCNETDSTFFAKMRNMSPAPRDVFNRWQTPKQTGPAVVTPYIQFPSASVPPYRYHIPPSRVPLPHRGPLPGTPKQGPFPKPPAPFVQPDPPSAPPLADLPAQPERPPPQNPDIFGPATIHASPRPPPPPPPLLPSPKNPPGSMQV